MAALRVYRELLANRPLSRLLLGEFISGIGDWLYIIAIFVVIYRESGDAALVGAFGGIRLLPYVILSVPAGIVADRFDRRMVLLVSDLFRGALMVLMAVLVAAGSSTLLIAALAILAACGSTFFYPAMGAYLPALAKDERQLGPANSAWATLGNISYIAGPAVGGLVLAFGSVTLAFVLNALTFLVVAFVLWSLPPSRAGDRRPAAEAAPGDPGAGAPALADATSGSVAGSAEAAVAAPVPSATAPEHSAAAPEPSPGAPATATLERRPLAGLTLIQLMAGLLGGGYQVITVILAIDVLKAGEEANGYLNAGIGVGGLAGAVVAGALVIGRGMARPLVVGAVIGGAGSILLGLASNLPFALAAIGISAAGGMIIDVISTTIFQRLVPDELRGRGMGLLMVVTTVTGAIGAFALPVLLTTLGPLPSLGGLGIASVVVTAAGVALIGAAGDQAPTPYEATVARIAKLPLFAGVRSARLETAMRQVVEVPVRAGEIVIRQGEPADRFYIIQSGSFTVTQVQASGGEPVTLRQLGPDQVFGELGLLYQMPRTATVAAETDGLLLALERDDFLELVGVGGPLRGRLLGLYAGGTPAR